MEIITSVLLLLTVALVLGELSNRVHIPAVTGEIFAGVLLGPAIFNFIQPNDFLSGFSEISLFFIVLLLGVDEDTETLMKNIVRGSGLSILGFVIPVLLMYFVSTYFLGIPPLESMFLSVAVGIPSISITSVLIRQYRLAGTKTGSLIISSVVVSDIVGFVMVSIATNPGSYSIKITGMAMLFAAIFLVDYAIRHRPEGIARFLNRIHAAQSGPKLIFGSIIVFSLLVSFILDSLGITYVLGAFFAGILVSDVSFGAELRGVVRRTLGRMESSFFGPMFFSIAGLEIVIPNLSGLKTLAVLIPITAVVGGALVYLAARAMKLKNNSRHIVGILGSRGAVGIVIATIGITDNILTANLYTIALFSTVLLSLIIPVLVSRRGVMEEEYGEDI